MEMRPFDQTDPKEVKQAFSTRRVHTSEAAMLITGLYQPRHGDVVLAEISRLGQHTGIQLPCGRRAAAYVGDRVVLAYGARYAPDQFESRLPEDLSDCDLAAGGGLASQVVAAHGSMKKPTRLKIHGVLARSNGTPLNLSDFAIPSPITRRRIPVIAVFGTSMNAGKTVTAASLVHGLSRSGMRVGAAKITGTGACGDFNAMQDAGAYQVCDFTDAGYPTTFGASNDEVVGISERLINYLTIQGCQVAVVEIADGVYQRETAALAAHVHARTRYNGIVFAAGDASGAIAGAAVLQGHGLNLLGVSGLVSASPLAAREAMLQTALPVLDKTDLRSPERARQLYAQLAETDSLEQLAVAA